MTEPPQLNWYAPVDALISSLVAGFESSCKQRLNAVTVNEQLAVFPDVSVAVHVTVDTPTGNTDPDGGTHAFVTPGQLSVATGAGHVAATDVAIGHDAPATAVTFAGHVIEGGWVSFTVTVNEQLAELPEASETEQLTVVVPFANVEPDAGAHVGEPTPGQLSLTVGAGYVTTAVQTFGSVDFVMFAGHVIDGGCVSFTVTVNVQLFTLFAPSATVHVTGVVPFGKEDPLAGVQVGLPTFGQLSVTVGAG